MAPKDDTSTPLGPTPVYVPAPGAPVAVMIADGSGIVGRSTAATTHPSRGAGPMVLCDYEGNLHGAVNLVSYADRVLIAHSRAAVDYPTIARTLVPADQLVEVGMFDPVAGHVTCTDPDALATWLGIDAAALDTELDCTGARHTARREILAARATGNPALRFAADQMARRMNIDI